MKKEEKQSKMEASSFLERDWKRGKRDDPKVEENIILVSSKLIL